MDSMSIKKYSKNSLKVSIIWVLKTGVFQQDLDSKHTAPAAQRFFNENNVTLLDWSPQSPDINVIENLWELVDQKVPITGQIKLSFGHLFKKCGILSISRYSKNW